jgi:cell fate regulator YaaT (PSP1 superfamily)
MENDNIDKLNSDEISNCKIDEVVIEENPSTCTPEASSEGSACACANQNTTQKTEINSVRIIDLVNKSEFSVGKVKHNGSNDNCESPYVEVSFKRKRKLLYKNDKKINFKVSEVAVVECESGNDIGTITATGMTANEKFTNVYNSVVPTYKILRHANKDDIEKHLKSKEEEEKVIEKTKELCVTHNLDMKVIDAEWQYDHQRLTVFFAAPQRIDFRNMVKDLARMYRTRIELRQISTREEAKRIGGMGSCGRDICCSSHICTNCHVTLDHARTQQLSNNVAKLSGYCGRLKCCLLFEYSQYTDILKDYPPVHSLLDLPEGQARLTKADIFKQVFFAVIPSSGVYKSFTFEEIATLQEKGKVKYPPREYSKLDGYTPEEIAELKALEAAF